MYIICTAAVLGYGCPTLMEPRRCLCNMWENTRNLLASFEMTLQSLLSHLLSQALLLSALSKATWDDSNISLYGLKIKFR